MLKQKKDIGFIDGDGSIRNQTGRKDTLLNIKVHSSWLNVLNEFKRIFHFECANPYINKSGYAMWSIGNHYIQYFLKQHSVKYKLPTLQRKWSLIINKGGMS